jgi:hypothetical protein
VSRRFCKIDVEGFEVATPLKGLSKTVPFLTIGYQSHKPQGIAKVTECLAMMAKLEA